MNKNLNKIIIISITIASMLLYIPVNRLVTGGRSLASSLDNLIPLIPVFAIPYLFGIVFWVFSIIYINLKADKKIAKIFNIMMITAGILSVIIYIVFPTFVVRPEVTGTDIFSSLIKIVYVNDNVYNAAPSGHTFYTLICFLNLYKLIPRYRLILFTISALIIISTVFTKQHNIIDVIMGFIFAIGIYLTVNALHLGKARDSSKAI